ncbi:MAG: sodium:proton exchanger [Candidatus Krumholzibacteriia bacterium]
MKTTPLPTVPADPEPRAPRTTTLVAPVATTAPTPPLRVPLHRRLRVEVGGVQIFEFLDLSAWVLVLAFFLGSAALNDGKPGASLGGAVAIIAVMLVVSAAIEVIIASLSDAKGLGTLVGFITNGPEALCLIVGLLAGDVLFAASTPLGSNVMNPVMLISAALLAGVLVPVLRTHPRYTIVCVGVTAGLATSFFFIPAAWRLLWLGAAVTATVMLFLRRPPEPARNDAGDDAGVPRSWFLPAFLVLVGAGYLLDPVVSSTAAHSQAPKGVIGFFVLSTLTSWPEFKSCLALNRRRRYLASVLNITVSNITNIWLAALGVAIHLAMR